MLDHMDMDDNELCFKIVDTIYSGIVNHVKKVSIKAIYERYRDDVDADILFRILKDKVKYNSLLAGFVKAIPNADPELFEEKFKIIGYRNNSEIRRAVFKYRSMFDIIEDLSNKLSDFVYNNEWVGGIDNDKDRIYIKFMYGLFCWWWSLYSAFGCTFYDDMHDRHIITIESEENNLNEEEIDIITYHELGHIYYGDNDPDGPNGPDEEYVDDENTVNFDMFCHIIREERANHFAITCGKSFGYGNVAPDKVNVDDMRFLLKQGA